MPDTHPFRATRLSAWCLAAVVLAAGPLSAAGPAGAVVGRGTADGRVLLGELNCTACHAPSAKPVLPPRQGPVLSEVGSRVTPQYLREYLAAPHAAKPGTVMPDLLHALPPAEKGAAADALAQYLATLGGPFPDKPAGVTAAQVDRGQALYHSVGCVACHAPSAPPPKIKRDGPPREDEDGPPRPAKIETPSVPLGDLARKTGVEPLAKFLRDPLHIHPSGRMPSLNLTPAEARDIAAYLLRDQRDPGPGVYLSGVETATFDGPFTKLPDVAKMTPTRTGEAATAAFPLPKAPGGKAAKVESGPAVRLRGVVAVAQKGTYRFGVQGDAPAVLTVAGMVAADTTGAKKFKDSTVDLAAGQHPLEAVFLRTTGFAVQWQPPGAKNPAPVPANALFFVADAAAPKAAAGFTPDAAKAAKGKELFASLGCASCHQTGKDAGPPPRAPDLAGLDPAKPGGCLAETPGKGRPRYDLTAAQRAALAVAVGDARKGPPAPDSKAAIAHTTTALNCVACHARGDSAPDAGRAAYFVYEAVADLGDEGRLPPALTGVGGKLTPRGFEAALFSPPNTPKYRPYMATRMPNFGSANAGHLPALFAAADAGFVPTHTPAFDPSMIADGRHIAGKNALACVNCHSWGGYRVQGAEGLDLLDTAGRLRPGWFRAWLLDPNAIRRGTRMPTGWPEGKSPYPAIQGGDAGRQIDAVWTLLQAGTRGGLPAGLNESEKFLVPADRPVVFRTFLDKVGAHSILVGFPERTHLAFDANRVRTAALWGGPFVSTKEAWDGRAGQYAPVPSPDAVRLPDGPPFAVLPKDSDPWPPDPPKPKLGSTRTPPGWKYLGYRLDDSDVPTFQYRVDGVGVEETPGVAVRKDGVFLTRRFVLSSPADVSHLYYRATAGQKVVPTDGAFLVDGRQRWRVAGAAVRPGAGGTQELVLPVKFTKAADGWTATFDVDVSW